MHLTTEELPRLFIPVKGHEAGGGEDGTAVTVLPKEGTTDKSVQINTSAPQPIEMSKCIEPQVSDVVLLKHASNKKASTYRISKDNDTCRKKWILQNYQFEHDDDECQSSSLETTTTTTENEVPKECKSLEEIRLEKIEKQIEMDTASLNDDAANYMRSKYEIEELKKGLKKSQQLAKALRKKIEKRKDKEMKEMEEKNLDVSNDHNISEEDYNGGMDNFFDKSAPVMKKENEEIQTDDVSSSSGSIISAGIPPGWTGKSPKELLLERCRKRMIPLPKFSQIAGRRNGCEVKIMLTPNKEEQVISHEGPFSSFNDAQQYTSTLALYQLEPNLPMYTLLPQAFKDLWKSLIEKEEVEKRQLETNKENDRNAQTTELLTAIGTLLETLNEDSVKNNVQGSMPPDDWDDESSGSGNESKTAYGKERRRKSKSTMRGAMLREEFKKKKTSHRYQEMIKFRKSLPIYDYRSQILGSIKNNPVTVICAETGAGKTTQCPQFILEDALESGDENISILCTQPRRISAISVAERVSEEIDEEIGAKVGFQVRMETKMSNETKLTFCTTGVVLRRLQDDPNLEGVTHIVVDECHERQWQIDFLLISLRQMLHSARSDLKVILMSATLDSDLFCSFFNNAPLLKIPGRTFPVSNYYLEDILEATGHIIDETSRNARCNDKQHTSLSLLITEKGGKQHKTSMSFVPELESLELSEYYEGYSLATRR
jgi:ATP-dependent RNA helicase DHX29